MTTTTNTMKQETKKQQKERERNEALQYLRDRLPPGSEVVTILRHVSASGMTRDISLFIVHNGQIQGITYSASLVTGYPLSTRSGDNALRVQGCGMDMGFSVVHNLGRYLYPEGFRLAEGQHGRNGDKSGFDTDGGYALKQRWL